MRPALSLDDYERGVLAGERGVLARAITLIESERADHAELAEQLLLRLLPHTGQALRVGITGVPGVGKSTFTESLGMMLCERGHKIAVLAVDPSSVLSGGSILGDKTRMARLAVEPRAYIRPSPSGRTPGGVARRTRESLLLCEAAGFDVVLVETVGVGQGEVAVAEMVDLFLLLMLPGSGDELQGIKKGVLELADVIAVNKADGDNAAKARAALADLSAALRYLPPKRQSTRTRVMAISGLTGAGLEELWTELLNLKQKLKQSGELDALRAAQQEAWTWSLIREQLELRFRHHPTVKPQLTATLEQVRAGHTHPSAAARQLLALLPS